MFTQERTSIFITGASGYIGGSVLTRLLCHPDAGSFDIIALTRSEEKAKKLKLFGVRTVMGSFQDLDIVEQWANRADVVINCANSDDLTVMHAFLRGMKTRYHQTGKIPGMIHTSGTGVIRDNAAGMYPSATIHFDSDATQMAQIPSSRPHRNIDLSIIDADRTGYIKSYLILPSTVYGIASGPLVETGIMNPHSQQLPALIKAALARGRAGMVGEGKNISGNVHIDDVADLYLVLFAAITSGLEVGHGCAGYYFGENGEQSWYDVSKTIALNLIELGRSSQPQPSSFTRDEMTRYLGQSNYGGNARCRAQHSKSIGWRPTRSTQDMLDSIKPEMQSILVQEEKQ